MSERKYDVVVFGATGFTGGLVAKYLAKHAPTKVRWALAGRDQGKLQAIADSLVNESRPPTGVILAKSDDDAALRAMAAQTRVVLSTVGPFVEHGEPLVRACVASGADYVDITGEPEFVSGMIDKYDDAARAAGVRIVSCCGFDSIPHDLGALYTVKRLPEGVPLEVEGFVRAAGSPSGGTWHSAIGAMARFRESRRAASQRRRPRENRKVGTTKLRVRYEKAVKGWICPLPTIDPQIVMQSARGNDRYGPEFRYGHFVRVKSLPTLIAGAAGIGALFALAQVGPTRELLLKVKKQGQGPSEEARKKAWFKVTFIGKGGGKRVTTEVSGGDPGYDETAKMVSESALCLALDRDQLPKTSGVITPALAMGNRLIERLQKVGIDFRVVEGA